MRPVVAIGASLGGLHALTEVLSGLNETDAAFACVQHRSPGGGAMLERLLRGRCRLPVREATAGARIEPGTITLAPADYHLLVDGEHFELSVDEPVCYARPSIDVLFESVAQHPAEMRIGVLLTASTDDGARGIAAIEASGGLTIVQDPADAESAVGPRAAIALAAVDHVVPLKEIGPLLSRLLGVAGQPPSGCVPLTEREA